MTSSFLPLRLESCKQFCHCANLSWIETNLYQVSKRLYMTQLLIQCLLAFVALLTQPYARRTVKRAVGAYRRHCFL